MTIHKTKSGYLELLGEWHDGAYPTATASGVACLTVHDDVQNSVWKFSGRKTDAVAKLADLFVRAHKVVILERNHLEVTSVPYDFWLGINPDFVPNTAKYPEIVAW